MMHFEQVSLDLNNVEEKIQDNCKGSMTPFKGKNLKGRLDKIYREASKLKDPEKTKVQTKVKELKKSVRTLLEAHEILGNLNGNCDCTKCNPSGRRLRRTIRL
ncbi:hypothetical protein [Pantoea dispersa]|uniref:hypothetical protein n=1 Tax=Pantoea dispersa TaxID=59814 RepID=UPI0030169470